MFRIDEDETHDDKKIKEHRNLAQFTKKTIEEIQELEQTNPREYMEILREYIAWCLKSFNEKCYAFNETAKRNLSNSHTNTDGGLTA